MSGGAVESQLRAALARLERPLAQAGFLVAQVRVHDEGSWGRLDATLEGTALSGKIQVHLNKKGQFSIVPQGNAAHSIGKAIDGGEFAVTAASVPPVRVAAPTRASSSPPTLSRATATEASASRATASTSQPLRTSTVRGRAGELVVDCSKYGKSLIGPTEWRGVLHMGVDGWREVFHSPLYARGHNNLGEFLAIIDGCQRIESGECVCETLSSDSKTALSWFRTGILKTTIDVENDCDPSFAAAVHDARQWLARADRGAWMKRFSRWDVSVRGENPADFGRK